MSTDASAVVLIHPDDDINTIIQRVRDAGSPVVQLLVPEGITELQSTSSCEQLLHMIESDQIGLMVISSDEKTLRVASENQLDTIAVQGAHVMAPSSLPAEEAPVGEAVSPAPATAQPQPAADEAYDPFAAELDSLGDIMSGQTSAEEYDPFAELDDLSATLAGEEPSAHARAGEPAAEDYDPFAELDDLSEAMSSGGAQGAQPAAVATGAPAASAPPPRKRIRPEDIELSAEEKEQASSIHAGGGRRAEDKSKKSKKSRSQQVSPELQEMRDQKAAMAAGEKPKEPSAAAPIPLSYILAVIVIPAVVVLAAIVWFGRTTITVAPPVIASEEIPFEDIIVPVAQPGETASDMSVQAHRLEEVISATETGQVLSEVQTPGAAARGTVTLLNQGLQALTLPAGTEFIGANAEGQEVRFTSDAEVVVPPATTVQQGRQIITTLGEADVMITARSAGSNSNIGGNAITHIALPGQEPFPVNSGALFIEHGPITGGGEETVRIVKEEDVRSVTEIALTSLDNQAQQQLRAKAEQQGLELQPTTIWPGVEYLATGQGYDITVVPEIGQPVADPNNPTFSVTVQAQYRALATPPDKPIAQQLQSVLPTHLQNTGLLEPGLTPSVTDWQWDGTSLIVDGVLQPPAQSGTLNPQTQATILHAVKGKTIEEARASLEQFKQQGIISGYRLPDKTAIPSWDFLVTLEVVPAGQ
jgi:hypothetical protein